MPDSWASSPTARAIMVANRGRDTRPALALRSAVHRLGLRFRVEVAPLQGLRRTADLLFPKARVVVLLDGCFWHGCPIHFRLPRTNQMYWLAKISANRVRDADTDRRFSSAGWTVVRVWEHESPSEAADRVAGVVRSA
jgi:DNA mismatch endonuclease (patch repair protein)